MRVVTLTQVEVGGIQEYIFSGNNLKQNIGASELVSQATMDWVVVALNKLNIKHNAVLDNVNQKWLLTDWQADLLPAQIVYWGGGNALILFLGQPEELAIPFTKQLTRRVIVEATGLSLIVAHQTLDWDKDVAAHKHNDLRAITGNRKRNRLQSTPLLGLGVTAACAFTNLPAVDTAEDGSLISVATKQKHDASEQGEKRIKNLFQNITDYPFVSDFNLLSEPDKFSYIALVHADGNGMGKRFQAIADSHPLATDNDKYCRQLRRLSEAIEAKATAALQATLELLLNSLDKKNDRFGGVVPFPTVLPFRPIVFGGDDVTFVSEGRLGLALTAYYLQKVAEGPLPGPKEGEMGDPLYSRAGVAIVKTHYPFANTYKLAEALCKSAKKKIPDLTPQGKGIVFDWHYATSGVILSLKEMRLQEYTSNEGHSLLMRPVRLDVEAPPVGSKYWRSWANFTQIVRQFQEDPTWHKRRNKIKALRGPLRQGEKAVKSFRTNYELPELPLILGQSTILAETGWNSEECGYFDAIEAMDFYVHLEEKQP